MKFSIILPVRNGGEYIKTCVASVLAQSIPDFELQVLENNSSDGTVDWLLSLNDPRIKIYPSDRPLTIEENWGRIVGLSKNEFITLIGHDDILEKDYLETMNDLIRQYPDASLYQTHFTYIDGEGKKIRDSMEMTLKERAVEFLQKFLAKEIDVMGTGFMMRSADYDRLGGIPDYPNLLFADFELWIRLTAISYRATSAKTCFSFRIHQSMTTRSEDTRYHEAFDRFMNFLGELRKEKKEFDQVIKANAEPFLLFYCRGLSHRLLRTPKSKRANLTVANFISRCKSYATLLGIENEFEPEKEKSIRLAKWIDQYGITRSMFLGFKRIFKNPVMK